MTNNTELETLALTAYRAYYATELLDADAIIAYIDDIGGDELRDALDTDIADLLSNGNACDLFPDMPADELESLETRLSNDFDFFDDFIDTLALTIANTLTE